VKLDFGCGNGGFIEISKWTSPQNRWDMMHRRSWFDIEFERVLEASRRIRNGTHFVVADGRYLPFKDNFFEIVHMHGILHHIPEYKLAVAEINRVLNGSFCLMEVVDNNVLYAIVRRVFKYTTWRGDKVASCFTADKLLEDLKEHFDIEETKFWWRTFPSELIFLIRGEGEPRISLYYAKVINFIVRKLHLEKRFACHFYVVCRSKK
jgi:ubiquinone/menaquinone biosynthesis C-methylase UbiE